MWWAELPERSGAERAQRQPPAPLATWKLLVQILREELSAQGFSVTTELAMGDPATELIRVAETRGVDLIAMSTHGHRFINDLLRGTTVDRVRHLVKLPVLLLQAQPEDQT